MLAKIRDFADETAPYRRRFGAAHGVRLWLRMRDWRYPPGTVYRVRVPGYKAPVTLRSGTSDRNVFRQMFLRGDAEFPVPPDPRLIIDAGANIGLTSVVLATRYPNATIVALEIDDGNFDALRRNVGPYPNVVPRKAGLWSRRTRLAIENPTAGEYSFRAIERSDGPIEAVGVQDLIDEFGDIDLLKIDIEGGEAEVFGRECPWLRRIRVLAVELHDRHVPGCRSALDNALAGRGFIESESGEYVVFVRPEVRNAGA